MSGNRTVSEEYTTRARHSYLLVQSARYAIRPAIQRLGGSIHRYGIVGVVRRYSPVHSYCITIEREFCLSAPSLSETRRTNETKHVSR